MGRKKETLVVLADLTLFVLNLAIGEKLTSTKYHYYFIDHDF
jgi:hypothetical protein